MRLDEEQIASQLAKAPDWKREGEKWIVKKFRFSAFPDGIQFVREIADIAERMNHHPFISIDYKVVTLKLTTWNSGGLTQLDFDSAEAYDRCFERY